MSTEIAKKQTKKVSTKTVKKVEEAPVAAPVEVKKVEKKKRLPSPKELPVEPAPAKSESTESTDPAAPLSEEEKMSRKKKNYNQLVSEVDNLNQLVDRYLTDHKGQEVKIPGLTQFLKNVEKGIKKVKIQVQKIGKSKSTGNTSSNTQSGFQKPVRISEAVASFTGWSASEPRARVEVTNFVCDYIKRNNLQSPEDRRVILADDRLRQLLDYQSERDGNLTYATIQKLLAKHYTALSSATA